jgi:hypothetical protein
LQAGIFFYVTDGHRSLAMLKSGAGLSEKFMGHNTEIKKLPGTEKAG